MSNVKYSNTLSQIDDGIKISLNFDVQLLYTPTKIRAKRGSYGALGVYFGKPFDLEQFGEIFGKCFVVKSGVARITNVIYNNYFDDSNGLVLVIAMNEYFIGGFAFSGLAKSVSDYAKGYISSANAIEYSRTYIHDEIFALNLNQGLATFEGGTLTVISNTSLLSSLRLVPGTFIYDDTLDSYLLYFSFSFGISNYVVQKHFVSGTISHIAIKKSIDLEIGSESNFVSYFVWGRCISTRFKKNCLPKLGYAKNKVP